MFKKKKLFGENISHSCDYCQNCIVEGGKNFCKYKKTINKKGKCSKFDYNPCMRKVIQSPTLIKPDIDAFKL